MGGVLGIFLVLLVVYKFWIPLTIGVVIGVWWRWVVRRREARAAELEAERREQAALRARADRQLEWWQSGDPRAIFGDPPNAEKNPRHKGGGSQPTQPSSDYNAHTVSGKGLTVTVTIRDRAGR